MLAVRLDPEMEARLTELAEQTGRSKSYYVKEALAEYLEERADYLQALAVLEKKEPRKNLNRVRKELGLDS